MEHAQSELIRVLLGHIHTLGLISDAAYSSAMDSAQTHFPAFFQYPAEFGRGGGPA